jgi:two-component system, cell cycle response regulator
VIRPVYDRPAVSSDPLLHRAIRAVARGSDPESTLDELIGLALEAAGAASGAVLLWDADQGGLAIAGVRAVSDADRARLETAAADPADPIYQVAHNRVPALGSASAAADARLSAWPTVIVRDGVEEPIGALVVLASAAGSTAVGEAGTAGEAGAADEAAERIAAIADLIAVTVDRTRLATEGAERADWVERVGNSDALTGLANARTLARVIELEIARAARQASELCVAVFDVDGLASINDAAGRAVGDDVLREVAAVAAESVRFVDTMARWGADEFMLVAPGATGTTVVTRIVEAVAARPPIGGQRITVSAGLARFPGDGTTGEALIEAATAALGAAKAVGPGTLAEAVPAAGASS